MTYATYRFTIEPLTAFGTPLVGDTLLGQLCWSIRHCLGNERLQSLLQGYCDGQPFAVVSDAFPHGFLPLPSMPSRYWDASEDDRKKLKKKRWLPVEELESPFSAWQGLARCDIEVTEEIVQKPKDLQHKLALQEILPQPHNTINRETGTTAEGIFAPYTQAQIWFYPGMKLDLYIVMDSERLTQEELSEALTYMGTHGYGRDASIGLGKFRIIEQQSAQLQPLNDANAWLTLAPTAPQGLGFNPDKSFYHPLTRFGRMGDAAVFCGNPFKRPVLMAKSGAVFTPPMLDGDVKYIGKGIASLSDPRPEIVVQGYAPVLAIHIEEKKS